MRTHTDSSVRAALQPIIAIMVCACKMIISCRIYLRWRVPFTFRRLNHGHAALSPNRWSCPLTRFRILMR